MLTVPNLLSIFRMGLIPLFVVSVLEGRTGRAVACFAVAGITDALDGFIARFWKQQSALGAYLDPLADKLLLVTAYVVLAIPHLREGLVIPAWITALVITRDVVIVLVALLLHLAASVSRFPPSPLSKVNTAVQLIAVIVVLLSDRGPQVEAVASILVLLVAALTVGSGIEYIVRANRMASQGGAAGKGDD
ncbi:MAG: CDP-alcohol phosphatidyltransferase family protein [Thermoanaerobaculia bacterium]